MAKKHEHTRTANGYSYKSYRKQATYRGQAFRAEAKSKADWEARFEAWKSQVDSNLMGADPNMRVHELGALFIEDSRTNGNTVTRSNITSRRTADLLHLPAEPSR